jgi:DNA-binding CsgD family transcriptional regulator
MKHQFNIKYLHRYLIIGFIGLCFQVKGQNSGEILAKGWDALIRDNDTNALRLFESAKELAIQEGNQENKALSLLYLGMGSYGASYSHGLQYAMQALNAFKILENTQPQKALVGRSRCLQLISTIKGRQGKFQESIRLSREAKLGFKPNDSTGTLGLIYNSIGAAYEQLGKIDSAVWYYQKALDELKLSNHVAYLPNAYCKMAKMELNASHFENSKSLFVAGLEIAKNSQNQQAQITCYLGLSDWELAQNKPIDAELLLKTAENLAKNISDKSFYLLVLQKLSDLNVKTGNYAQALSYKNAYIQVKDSINTWEKQRITKNLEIQFEVMEKDRRISLIEKENKLNTLTILILLLVLTFSLIAIYLLRKTNKKHQQLIQVKEDLAQAVEAQRRLQEQHLNHEIDFKESQLSAMTLQMQQKNDLLKDLKDKLQDQSAGNTTLERLIEKSLNQDSEWLDFNQHFESINKNFYHRLKQAYSEISPNDLKICALIKLNKSIKEMAAVLNISPDSVKTARYRLRKKLNLQTEDNLTDFILKL